MAQRGWLWLTVWVGVLATSGFALGEDAKPKKEETNPVNAPEKNSPEAPALAGELGLKAARFRLELYLGTGTPSGHRDRDGDFVLRTALDYEIPVHKHMTVAPRLLPYTLIHESLIGGADVSALGIGIALRGYSNGEEHRGWFGEGSLNVLAQSGKFDGNSGTFNFMEEIAVGYMGAKRWHVAAKLSHMSNAGLASHNAGFNTAGVGIGYTFKPCRSR